MAKFNYQTNGSTTALFKALDTLARMDRQVENIPDAEVLIIEGFTRPSDLEDRLGWDLGKIKASKSKLVMLVHPSAKAFHKEWKALFAAKSAFAYAPESVVALKRAENDQRHGKALVYAAYDRIGYSTKELETYWIEQIEEDTKEASSRRNARATLTKYELKK